MSLSKKNDPRCWDKWRRSGSVLPVTIPPARMNVLVEEEGHSWAITCGKKGQHVKVVLFWSDLVTCSGENKGTVRVDALAQCLEKAVHTASMLSDLSEISRAHFPIPVMYYESRAGQTYMRDALSGVINIPLQAAEPMRQWLNTKN